VTADSGIVTADSGKPGKSVTFARNDRSRSIGMLGHVRPESSVTLGRNTHRRNISDEFKAEAVQLVVAQGYSFAKACEALGDGDGDTALRRWVPYCATV
jgi:hypothetical protein